MKPPRLAKAFPQGVRLEADLRAQEPGEVQGEGDELDILAYTGAAVNLGFGVPVVFDVGGMDVSAAQYPILRDHNTTQEVGVARDVEKTEAGVTAKGTLLPPDRGFEAADRVRHLREARFPLQASVWVAVVEEEFVPSGATLEANGRTFEGPAIHVARSRLREISICTLGADGGTVAASQTTAPLATAGKGG